MSLTVLERAAVLAEALPGLQRLRGAVVVVKLGGHAMVDDHLLSAFAQDIALLQAIGAQPVVVHGGGPQISAELTARGIPSEFRAGLRVTTAEVLDVVRSVLVDQVQRTLVGLIQAHGGRVAGVAGDEGLLTAERHFALADGAQTDIGLVGEVSDVDAPVLRALLDDSQIPVISTVALGRDGTTYNVNADTAAAAVAVALTADQFTVLTDVPGLYRNWPDTSELIEAITVAELEAMLPRLEAGMVPKMAACIAAIRGGLTQVTVVDGRQPHCLLVQVVSGRPAGTVVLPEVPR